VVADGNLFFAGWSPGDPGDKNENTPKWSTPSFDEMLKQSGEEKLGYLVPRQRQTIRKGGTQSHESSSRIVRLPNGVVQRKDGCCRLPATCNPICVSALVA
jgi:hypothetical protein